MLIIQEKYQTSKMKAEEAIYLMDTNQVNRLNQGIYQLSSIEIKIHQVIP